ncbi:reverse transcriptase domain-containing protein [Paludisphaera soli]|uniref:reverse transcriptase domain-containing protein n=1 Tax=Paludisphaera soli TaxID=2712865 RepID=UPI0013ED3054|nr:reverse transcriptase domain-containing protein [Paludisphaera soli]
MSSYGSCKQPRRTPHGDPAEQYRSRRDRRRVREASRLDEAGAGSPTLARIADREALIAAYHRLKARGGRGPGRDGITYTDLGLSEVAAILDDLATALRSGAYKPGPALRRPIPKPGGRGTRTLSIRNLTDRVVSAAVLEALTPAFEPTFSDRSHGFRPGRGTWSLLAALEADATTTGSTTLAIDDVRNAFDNVSIAHLMEDLREHVKDPRLLTLIEAVVRGGEDEDRTRGIPQGDPLAPLLLNVRLHVVHDLPLHGDPDAPPWHRYADNLCYLAEGVPEGREILQHARDLLLRGGHELKGEDGPPIDLRQGVARLLGFDLSIEDDRLRLGVGEDAWGELRQGLDRAHEEETPPDAARAVVRGWVESYGPAFEIRTETDVPGRILGTAADLGFRELASRRDLAAWCEGSRRRWEALREGTLMRRRGPGRQGAAAVAAPPATTAPGGRSTDRPPRPGGRGRSPAGRLRTSRAST